MILYNTRLYTIDLIETINPRGSIDFRNCENL